MPFIITCQNTIFEFSGSSFFLVVIFMTPHITILKETTITTNCYKENSNGSTFLDETSLEAKYDLASKDYLGTDGTIIGVYGGTTPLTLDPQVAKVTESSFTVDTTTKKLTVKLKVAAQ